MSNKNNPDLDSPVCFESSGISNGEDISNGSDIEDKMTVLTCGGCKSLFEDIYVLHSHMRDHVEGGSYKYNHLIRTAFPVSISKNAFTQTNETSESEVDEPNDTFTEILEDKTGDFAFVTSEDSKKSDYADGMCYRIVKTEIKDGAPFTDGYADVIVPDTPEISDSFEKHVIADDVSRPDLDSKVTEKTERAGKSVRALSKKKRSRTASDRRNVITKLKVKMSNKISIQNAKVKCEQCGVVITNKHIKRHVLRFHSGTKKATKTKEENDDETPYPKDSDEKQVIRKEAKPKFQCDMCGKEMKCRKNLKRHIRNVHEKVHPKFECDKCGRKVQNLKLHNQNVHEKTTPRPPSICETCGRVFPTGLSLARHKIVHTEKYLTCRYCSHLSSTHEEFQAHLKIHRKAKVYTCHVCGAVFNTPGNIHKHIRSIHMGERRYFCDVCNKGFYTKGHLQAHRAIHFEATIPCSFCDRKFKEAGSKRIHERIHRGDQRYRCHICDHGFVQAGCYWSHMLKRHSIPKQEAMVIRQQQMAVNNNPP